ncbi:unnamed protein product, partial [Brenthis ino]
MKDLVLLALFVLAAANIDYYVLEYEDMAAVVRNVTKLQSYVDCVLDRTPPSECSDLVLTYKRITPECMEQACMRCTPSQKNRYWRFLEGIRLYLPEDYEIYRKHFDPDNKYFDNLIEELSNYKDVA